MGIKLLNKKNWQQAIVLVNKQLDSTNDETVKKQWMKYNNKEYYIHTTVLTYLDDQGGMISLNMKTGFIHFLLGNELSKKELLQVALDLTTIDLYAIYQTSDISLYKQFGFVQEQNQVHYTRETKKRFDSYEQVCHFIASQKDRVYSLDNFKHYMQALHNPQLALNCVHIGGTNGKGSTTNYIREVLQDSGYKVGTFTSPAMYSRLDIIRVQNQFIDDATMVRFANRYVDLWLKYEISMFEIEVFIALMYFIEQGVDLAIFEVGLGGSLDATNIIRPLVAVNTNIGMDHVDYLGHTYQSIAYNKAGIVKDGIDYITGERKAECLDVFKEVCKKHHSKLIQVPQVQNMQDGYQVSYDYHDLHIVLNTPALYQVDNSMLAISVLEYLKEHNDYQFSKETLLKGLYEASWPGRFEKIHEHPLVILDGAHNKEGIARFVEGAKKYQDIKIVFSALKDKDTNHMIEQLLTLTDDLTITQFPHPRGTTAKDLAKDYPVKIETDFKKAVDEAFCHQGTVFITGSLYFISQVRQYLQTKERVSKELK
ncbi:folylpolyglutamate synthase/dihydrofolate synthase family protein [Coprobacillus sp. AF33-1AC]|uniref:bifunctional folylpolyglutamate synthase/dihydrofolate synthase n=1 Tax=Coprobacillus sp. AF33-1AC TaxID=2292032 RepID=UPI000E5139F9|nr:folylpolyglutamate synthase/dihydrofolate synthase family protein [Coprobacillus sp. AF33-1AC]RHM62841.1 bifunctional folylpolyglutamate synthase/dihydrofolate synthase [Coprobacillus sp. AF33-1AC]